MRSPSRLVAGVSTRGCGRSLEPLDESLESRGESKSNASRALLEKTTEKLADFLSRKLDDVALAAMFIDGIEIGGHAVIIALGVTKDGTKVPLGVWCGSTENHVVTAALMQNLIERGLRVDAPVLFVIDGRKGTLRRVIHHVKRWQGETMIKRWVALGVSEAQRGFRRVKGHGQMNVLLSALGPKAGVVEERKVA